MAWIAWVKGLTHRAEVLSIAHQLNISPHLAAACCMFVWEWADDETENGTVTNVPLVSLFCHADSGTGVQGFGAAFASVGWVVQDGNDIRFPNWDRFNGPTAKTRMKEAARKARWRDKRDKCPATTRDKTGPTEQNRTIIENPSKDSLAEHSLGKQNLKSSTTEPKPRKPREPDPIWDMLAGMFFPDGVADGDRARLGRVVRDLGQMHATPEEIQRRVDVYVRRMPDMPLTLEALRKHWGPLGKEKKRAPSILDLIQ